MSRTLLSLVAVLTALAMLTAAAGSGTAEPGASPSSRVGSAAARSYTTETLRGRVVWLDDALARLYDISTDPAAAKAVALQDAGGHLTPLVPDVRGWAFAVDERLRNVELELLVRRHAELPWVQIIQLRKRTTQGLVEIDYWCDVCAISMFTLKSCECCQGPTRLRETPVEP